MLAPPMPLPRCAPLLTLVAAQLGACYCHDSWYGTEYHEYPTDPDAPVFMHGVEFVLGAVGADGSFGSARGLTCSDAGPGAPVSTRPEPGENTLYIQNQSSETALWIGFVTEGGSFGAYRDRWDGETLPAGEARTITRVPDGGLVLQSSPTKDGILEYWFGFGTLSGGQEYTFTMTDETTWRPDPDYVAI